MHGIPRLVMFMIHFLHKLIAGTKNKSTQWLFLAYEVIQES